MYSFRRETVRKHDMMSGFESVVKFVSPGAWIPIMYPAIAVTQGSLWVMMIFTRSLNRSVTTRA